MIGHISMWMPSEVVAELFVAQSAVAQSGSELLAAILCSRLVAPALIALWGLFVLFLTGSGIFRFVNGWRKTRSSRSRKIREGRKEMKGSFYVFGAALIVIGAERLFAFWIVDVMDCALAVL